MNNETGRALSLEAKYYSKKLESIIRKSIWYKRFYEWENFLEKNPSIKRTLCELDNFIGELGAYGTESGFAKEALGQVFKDKSL